LISSGFLAIHAVWLLRRHGRPGDGREEEPLYDMERTTRLVTEGIYAYIRHPMYSSLLFLAWGIAFKDLTWVTGVLVLLITGLLLATARADEEECVQYFGAEYEEYMIQTKRFIPFVY
jgi:protein-S-isoprenylcysteine O-methyltransferase Ste14